MTSDDEVAQRREERRKLKAAEREANHARFEKDLVDMLQPLPEQMDYHALVSEHQRLRTKIMEMQQLVIVGRFDHTLAQDMERRIVEQIHKVEEKSHGLQSGGAAEERPGPPE